MRADPILIVGGGNAAQAYAAYCGKVGVRAWLFSPVPGEADALWQKWNQQGLSAVNHHTHFHSSPPEIVTADAKLVAQAWLVMLCVPSFAQEPCLRALAQHLRHDVILGACPGGAHFDLLARNVGVPEHCTLFATRTLPWACRVGKDGVVHILGTKHEDDMVCNGDHVQRKKLCNFLSRLTDHRTVYHPAPHFLHLAFTLPWHPVIMYGQFRKWDGKTTFKAPPLFYEEISLNTANLLLDLSAEVLEIRDALVAKTQLDLSKVVSITAWFKRSYGLQHTGKGVARDLQASICSNPSYQGLQHTMKLHQTGGLIPDFGCRYMREDVPDVLCVHRGIAELVNVLTPRLDSIIVWAQTMMGKEYLTRSSMTLRGGSSISSYRLNGRDIGETRSPQRFGITLLAQLVCGQLQEREMPVKNQDEEAKEADADNDIVSDGMPARDAAQTTRPKL